MHQEAKESVISLYKHRMKKVLKSQLHGASKIHAVNAYALPVLTFTTGIVKWTKDELNELECEARKIMTLYKVAPTSRCT
jgi:hypothetical protein